MKREHQKQMKKLIEQNGQLAAALAKAKGGEAQSGNVDRRNQKGRGQGGRRTGTKLPSNGGGGDGKGRSGCEICDGPHATKWCYELDRNKANRPSDWVSTHLK